MDDSGAFVIDHGPDVRYRIGHQDNSRWDGFVFHPGDIVISTRSRSGTTWMQMICALLIFQAPDLPAPLAELSPWMEGLSLDRHRGPASLWPELVSAATFHSMRSRAERLTPGPPGLFLDDTAFFRNGRSGTGNAILTPGELGSYWIRVAEMASRDVVSWLHRDV